ncbi:ferric-chelate reductase [Rhodosporidiobolus nylandii]
MPSLAMEAAVAVDVVSSAFDTALPHLVSLASAGQSAEAKLEKARQKAASLYYTNVYSWIAAGLVAVFVLRNVLLISQRFLARRRSRNEDVSEKGKGSGSILYGQKPFLLRASDRIDGVFLKQIPGLPSDWTYLRLLLVTFIVALNVAFCLVVSVHLITPESAGSSVARSLSRRCGRMAIANYPWLFMFAGRNNIISMMTGIPYQELRFYHILLGAIAFIQSFVHTFAYIAHYTIWQGVAKLHSEYEELYFKMGIVAVVFMFLNCLFGLKWLRRRSYEIFLALHVVGAALILAGTWYHRPVAETWVYAAAGIWIFERLTRGVSHFASIVNSRLILRRPVVRARATVCEGAIKLSVPFPDRAWQAGQHVYISFWGLDLLRRPHLYGQAHPFSIANVPDEAAGDAQALRFVLRVHNGITRELANHIQRKGSGASADCLVSLEGPHGWAPRAEEFDSILLVAGGSGITHPASVLADVCNKVIRGDAVTSSVKLCWALQRIEQTAWVDDILQQARSQAEKAKLSLAVDLFVTRSASPASSGTSTPTAETPNLTQEEHDKKDFFGQEVDFAGKARRFSGRPNIAEEVQRAVEESAGRTLIIACGPAALAAEVARATSPYLTSSVEVQIAKFEC